MVETTKKITDVQRNADEMVAVGFKENLAMKVASIIERSIATPIDGLRVEIKGIRDGIEKLDKKVGWFSGRVAISAILLLIGACGYMSKQVDDLNTDVGEIKGAIVQMEKRFDDQFEQVDTQFEKVDAKFEQVDARIEKVDEKVTKLQVDFARMDERITGIDGRMTRMEGQMTEMQGRMTRMDERMTRVEGTVNQIFEFMKEQAGINSSVPEAVPGETDISFDPDQGQPTMKPKEDQIDQIKGKLGSHPTQPGSTPLTKQADVGPDAQPIQAGQPKPPHNGKGGGIGGPESYPSE